MEIYDEQHATIVHVANALMLEFIKDSLLNAADFDKLLADWRKYKIDEKSSNGQLAGYPYDLVFIHLKESFLKTYNRDWLKPFEKK